MKNLNAKFVSGIIENLSKKDNVSVSGEIKEPEKEEEK